MMKNTIFYSKTMKEQEIIYKKIKLCIIFCSSYAR